MRRGSKAAKHGWAPKQQSAKQMHTHTRTHAQAHAHSHAHTHALASQAWDRNKHTEEKQARDAARKEKEALRLENGHAEGEEGGGGACKEGGAGVGGAGEACG